MAIQPLDSSASPPPAPIQKATQPLVEPNSEDQGAPASPVPPTNTQDTLNLSQERADYDAIQTEIAQLPDIRQERVKEIRNALQSGQYQVSSEDLADRLIQDTILNEPRKEP